VSPEAGFDRFQGDISLTPSASTPEVVLSPESPDPTVRDAAEFFSALGVTAPFGLVMRRSGQTWPDGIIPFVCEAGLAPIVDHAIAHWHAKTPLRLVAYSGQQDYVSFEDHGECLSSIGRQGSGQVVRLSGTCTVGAVVHEIGHVVGLWHEHSRADRGNHVRVVDQNIQPGQKFNFDVHNGAAEERGNYDLHSIMHYPSDAFSNGGPTLLTLAGATLPPRNGLSDGDVLALRSLYPDLDWPAG
jgi:hypothetical protein